MDLNKTQKKLNQKSVVAWQKNLLQYLGNETQDIE